MHNASNASGQPLSELNTASAATPVALSRWVDRMEELIGGETMALANGDTVDFDCNNAKKNHALLELMILARNMSVERSPEVAGDLARLRAMLAKNAEMLEQHLLAMSEISNLLINSIQSELSDGTYANTCHLRR